MEPQNDLVPADRIERGLRFGHILMSINRHVSREAALYSQTLLALLLERGLLTAEEFEAQLKKQRQEQKDDPQVMLSKAPDKYTLDNEVIIDCSERLHLCHAKCCTFRFYLAPQDLDERIVQWDYGNPYWIRQREDGYCVHCDSESYACHVHESRPFTCRMFDCRKDKRIWADFENMIPGAEAEASEERAQGQP